MAKTGTKTRQGKSAKALTGSKGGSTQSKRNGPGGDAKGAGTTRAERLAAAKGDNPNPGK